MILSFNLTIHNILSQKTQKTW